MKLQWQEMIKGKQYEKSIGTGKACGTFGELLQGRLEENHLDFLVTFPIACYTHATYVPLPVHTSVKVFPPHKQKSLRLANMVLDHYDLPHGGELIIDCDLPIGKGLASSSADLVATARALSSCFGLKLPLQQLQTFLRQIEPSDGVMYPGIVSFYHRKVQLREFLGILPPIVIVSVDEGGELDTCHFNEIPKPFTKANEQEYQSLLKVLSEAIKKQDLQTVGKVTTISARLNQKLSPKQTLEDIIKICEEIQGLGVVVAHSGTCLGILLSPRDYRYKKQLEVACKLITTFTKNMTVYYSLGYD